MGHARWFAPNRIPLYAVPLRAERPWYFHHRLPNLKRFGLALVLTVQPPRRLARLCKFGEWYPFAVQ
ncbi:Uncharacterised protein [Vibrio cholerae]|nr:Uncharacterised protein [Vibrio cholerae]